ncbi:hypothetical protein L6164_006150 [Bauhinia variegata]|uniref:Uncharacterized protein n=1 Tax=Bauhinia variegata TaxID=167791 RepID=A0ACB9PU35_BAUVA|nr:hypothetical protein L6164_006150 [Bauhinia variegata]
MSDQTASQSQTIDPYEFLQIAPNSDGTITHLHHDPKISPTSDPNLLISVISKDITINQSNDTYVRIFLPRKALDHASSDYHKLPLIVYFHGGGFLFCTASSKMFHEFCSNMANDTQAVVAFVNYRLAP